MYSFTINENVSAVLNESHQVHSNESAAILQKLKEFQEVKFLKCDKPFVEKLKTLDARDLTHILNCFFIEMARQERIDDPVKFLESLTHLIPFSVLHEGIMPEEKDIVLAAKSTVDEAKLYLETTGDGGHYPQIQGRVTSLIKSFLSLIESFITAFGLRNFFKSEESDIHADLKTRTLTTLLTLFGFIATMTIPIFGPVGAGIIIVKTLLAIAALSAVWPLIKPKITHLPANAENWTEHAQKKGFTAQARKETLDQIAATLKMNRHVLLIGHSIMSKELTPKAFVQALKRGDYPELQNKSVFRLHTRDLLDYKPTAEEEKEILKRISTIIGPRRNDIILILEDIHLLYKNNETMADQLASFLKEDGEFPHVIAMTTADQFEKSVKHHPAFSLRFDRVDIENTDPDETLKILSEAVLKSHSKPIIKEDVLNYIYQKTSKSEHDVQPASALKLLKRCIHRTEKTDLSPTEKKVIEISNKIFSLRAQSAAARGRKPDVKTEIIELEADLQKLQQALFEEKKELDKLLKTKQLYDQVTTETYQSILKIAKISQSINRNDEKQLKLFMLQQLLGKTLEELIKNKSEELGINLFIDKALVDQEFQDNMHGSKNLDQFFQQIGPSFA